MYMYDIFIYTCMHVLVIMYINTQVIWTYDVAFKASTIKWSTRWDTYLQSADDAEVINPIHAQVDEHCI